MVYDLIIIGAGPAGLTSAIYAKRAGLNFILLQDKYSVGSQICNTYEVCNFPGVNNVSGQDLYDKFLTHAKELGATIKNEKAIEITDTDLDVKKVKTNDDEYETKTILLATGASPKKAGLVDEDKFVGKGISYCATCDGAFYRDKVVAVIGGGNVAVEDAIFLSRIAKKVYLVVRKNIMRATKILQDEINKLDNVEILYETVASSLVVEGEGDKAKLTGIILKKMGDVIGAEYTLDGVFVGIGSNPDISLIKDKVEMDGEYIKADETCATSIKGIYAAGDIRSKALRQVITAASDGANAITSIQKYLITKETN